MHTLAAPDLQTCTSSRTELWPGATPTTLSPMATGSLVSRGDRTASGAYYSSQHTFQFKLALEKDSSQHMLRFASCSSLELLEQRRALGSIEPPFSSLRAAARVQQGMRPNGAHRWHSYVKTPK